jgi:hypothetical protein
VARVAARKVVPPTSIPSGIKSRKETANSAPAAKPTIDRIRRFVTRGAREKVATPAKETSDKRIEPTRGMRKFEIGIAMVPYCVSKTDRKAKNTPN